jgi:DNA-binding NarL/FixJ family response regulator
VAGTDRAAHGGLKGGEPSVFVIDARPLMRHWLCQWLTDIVGDLKIVPVTSPADLSRLQLVAEARLVVLSVGGAPLSDAQTLQVVGSLIDCLGENPLLIVGDCEKIDEIINVLERGVRGYVPTSLAPMEAAEAVRFVLGGGRFVPAGLVVRSLLDRRDALGQPATNRNRFTSLTPREMEVLSHLRHGAPNKVIARELGVSESTVKAFVQRILSKLQAANRTEVAYLAKLHSSEGSGLDRNA